MISAPSVTGRSSTTPRGRVYVALGAIYLIWGSVYLAIRLVIEDAPALGSMGARFVLAALIMAAFVLCRKGFRAFRITWRQGLGLLFLGVMLLALGNGLTAVGQNQGVPSGVTALLIATVPLWIALCRTISGDRPSARTLVGIGVGLAGLAVLVLRGGEAGALPVVGVLVILGASLAWSIGSWLQPRIWLPKDVLVGATYQLLAAGLVMSAASLVAGEPLPSQVGLRPVIALIYLVVIGSIVGFTTYAWLLGHAPISLIATHAYVNPVVAVLLGWLVLGEPITPAIAVGGGIVVGSVGLVILAERVRPAPTPVALREIPQKG